jgi:hypothetical protein
MKCTVQDAKSPVKKISSGSVARRDLIPVLIVQELSDCWFVVYGV